MDVEVERKKLARIVRQKLESLGRSGIRRIEGSSELMSRAMNPSKLEPAARVNPSVSETPVRSPGVPQRPKAPDPAPSIPKVPTTAPASPRPPARPTIAASLFEEPTLDLVVPPGERADQLAQLAAEVARCIRCPHLASTRTQTVFGEGSTNPRLMFVGEAPGADEDATGRPFVGRAGALLTDMITKGMGLTRDEVYIANVLKSRPPDNRTPLPEEMANCLPYLEKQIAILRPDFLCLLGKTAASALLETALPLGKLRGKWFRYRGIATIVTYHPSALLRNPAWKRDAWADLQILMNAMGLKAPERKRPG